MRELLRKRGHLVQLRTSLINSLQGIISRNCGCRLSGNKIKRFKDNHIAPLLADQEVRSEKTFYMIFGRDREPVLGLAKNHQA